MNEITTSRRDWLRQAGALALGGTGLVALGGCETLLDQIRHRPTRRNISTLATNDPIVQAYRAAVSAMQALPMSDARNWTRQAQIHNSFCPHGNWFFLPWHRAYLYYFETICRKLAGDKTFALPYWDWTCARAVPAHFWGAGNALNHTRSVGPSDQLSDAVVGETVLNDILDLNDFQQFGSGFATQLRPSTSYGQLEATPHNSVHGWMGGDMGTFMSPLDPVFWCHHNMIESCWVEWNLNRLKPNPNDATWYQFSLANMFCDADGDPVTNLNVAVTALMPLLSYQFDNQMLPCPAVGASIKIRDIDAYALREFLKKGGPSGITPLRSVAAEKAQTLRLNGVVSQALEWPEAIVNLLQATSDTQRIVLKAQNVTAQQAGDSFVRVFVNQPDANAATPITDPHYAGSFAFFGADHHAMGHTDGPAPDYLIDITKTLQRLGGSAGRSVSFQFVLMPLRGSTALPAQVTIGSVNLSLSRLH